MLLMMSKNHMRSKNHNSIENEPHCIKTERTFCVARKIERIQGTSAPPTQLSCNSNFLFHTRCAEITVLSHSLIFCTMQRALWYHSLQGAHLNKSRTPCPMLPSCHRRQVPRHAIINHIPETPRAIALSPHFSHPTPR
jgi:hypothetical protein